MHTRIPAAAALAALFGASSGADVPFSFDDIDFWVGEGTNRAAIVIDWSKEGAAPLAWGFRWNGDATAADALLAIVHKDNRLQALTADSTYGLSLYALGYDYADVGASFDFDYNKGNVIATSSDPDAFVAGGWYNGYWGQWIAPVSNAFVASSLDYGSGLSYTELADSSWHVLQFSPPEWGWDAHSLAGVPVAASAPPFTFADIHYWVGEGTNRAALVVDFSRDGYAPRAWGFRWNGDATAADALLAIVHEDNRLHALTGDTDYGLSLYALGYDLADVAAAFRFDYNRGNVVAEASDADAIAAGGWYNGYWSQWTAPVDNTFDNSSLGYGDGLSYTALADGSWHVLQFQRPEWGWDTHPLSGGPLPAESPYGWRVAAADVASVGMYGNPTNALGHPSLSVPEWKQQNVPPTPATPAAAAWGAGVIVSLETAGDEDVGGSITLEFDHPVLDDPRNPFGLDFIVFGNALQQIVTSGGSGVVGNADPSNIVFGTGTGNPEPGLVEVSQDGATWFTFTNGPYADSFAPTLSHLYDPEHADSSLFDGNLWWGATADATRPVDPAVSFGDFQGKNLAEYATLYDGSAGGTGFDIAGFDLPADAQGRKWIRFVRITTLDPNQATTEIDAIADVSPAPSFRNWVDTHVAFADRPGYAKTTVCANGLPAYVNAALGLAPDTPSDGAFAVTSFAVEDGAPVLRAPLAPYAYDLVRLRWSDSLETSAAQWQTALPIWHAEDATQSHAEFAEAAEVSSRVPSSAPVLSRPAQARPAPALRVPAAAAPDGAAFYRIELHD